VFEAHRRVYHSTQVSKVIIKKKIITNVELRIHNPETGVPHPAHEGRGTGHSDQTAF